MDALFLVEMFISTTHGGGACGLLTSVLIKSWLRPWSQEPPSPHWPKIDQRIKKAVILQIMCQWCKPTEPHSDPSRASCLTFLMYAAMSFSMLYFSMACVAQSTASCCMSSDMSAFLITAFLSVMVEDDDGRLLGEGGRSTVTHHTAPHWKLTPHVVMGMVFRPAGSTQTSIFTQTIGRLAPRFFPLIRTDSWS